MRAVPQQPPVLDRRRFALFAVGDDNRAAAATAVVAHGAQLDRQRERRAATAEQPGQVDLAQQVIDIVERLVAALLAVLGVVLVTLQQQPRLDAGPRRDGESGGGRHDRPPPADRLAAVRTAVVRIRVDPAGQLTGAQLADGMANLRDLATPAGIDVLENNLAAMPAGRREVEMLMVGGGPEDLKATAVALCAKAFGTNPSPGC